MALNFEGIRDSAVNNATWIAHEAAKNGRLVFDAGVKAATTISSNLLALVAKIKSLDFAVTANAGAAFLKSTVGIAFGGIALSIISLSVAQKQTNSLIKLALNVLGIGLIIFGGAALVRPGINFFGIVRL